MMKHILILLAITTSTIGCAATPVTTETVPEFITSPQVLSDVKKEELKKLELQYNIAKQKILSKCTKDADHLERIATNRDAGIPIEAMIGVIFERAKEGERVGENILVDALLYQTMLVTVIYNNKEVTPVDAFNAEFNDCTTLFFKYLAFQYERRKAQLLNRKDVRFKW